MMKSKNLLIRFGLVLILGLAAVGCPPPELIKPPEVDKPPEVETGPQEIAERPAVEKPPLITEPEPDPVEKPPLITEPEPAPVKKPPVPTDMEWVPANWGLAKGDYTLIYEVTFTKGSHKAEVTIHLDDPAGEKYKIYLRKRILGPFVTAPDRITNLRATNSVVTADSWIVRGAGEFKLSYTVDINVESIVTPGEYGRFAARNWIVTCGSTLFIVKGSRSWGRAPQDVRLKVNAPEGWVIHTPYPEISPGEFALEGMIHHVFGIRDFLVIADPQVLDVAERQVGGTDYKVVAVDSHRVDAEKVLDYIIDLSAVYSDIASGRPPSIFVVTAPDPMRRWSGEATCVSIFVSDNNPFPFGARGHNTWGHELFHLYRRSWFEGDLYWFGQDGGPGYYQVYGLFRAGYITAEEFLNIMINEVAGKADKDAILARRECIFFKGSVVTLALDIKIRQDSGGKFSLNDVFRELNRRFAFRWVSLPTMQLIIEQLTGKCYDSFFQRYVLGSDFPHEILATATPEVETGPQEIAERPAVEKPPLITEPEPDPVEKPPLITEPEPAPVKKPPVPTDMEWVPANWGLPQGDYTLIYEVTFTKGSNKANVTIHLNDPAGEIYEIFLRKRIPGPFVTAPDRITNLRATNSVVTEDSWIVRGAGEFKLSYTVDINVESIVTPGEYGRFAARNWIVTCGGTLFIVKGSRSWGRAPQDVRLKVNAPEGWVIHTPYPEISPGEFALEGMIHHIFGIRDFLVIADPQVLDVAERQVGGTDYKVVAVDSRKVDAEKVLDYIIDLSAVYSDIASGRPPSIFVVTAPDPMWRWSGEATCVSIFVSDNNPFPFGARGHNTWGHELFHLYQWSWFEGDLYWFGQDGSPGYYQVYGLFRAGYITAEEFLNIMINEVAGKADRDAILARRECIFFKGSVVTLALDIKIRQDSDGKFSLNDVFRELNRRFVLRYVSLPTMQLIIEQLTGECYDSFFQRYVRGSDFPHEILATATPELFR
jgi:hypothetical protein